MFWTALSAGSIWYLCSCGHSHRASDVFISKKSRHILETHWLGFSMSIVIFARGHGSGSVDRQCNNSDVSSGAITGSSPSFGRYCMAAAALPLLRWLSDIYMHGWLPYECWVHLAVLCAGASTSQTGASLVLGRLAGMTNVGCTVLATHQKSRCLAAV